MVVVGADAVALEELGRFAGFPPVAYIHDARARIALDNPQHPSLFVLFLNDIVSQVVTFETLLKDVLFRKKEFLLDVADHFGCGSGGEGEDGHFRKILPYFGNFEIGRTEVVAPLGDAVGLVHGQHLHGHPLQVDTEQVGLEPFR